MLERLNDAMNSHDALGMAALFAQDYQSAQPLHPSRAFGGRAQVLENWLSVFEGVPDFVSDLVASSVDGHTEWGEWDWHGHHTDGSPFAMRVASAAESGANSASCSSESGHRSTDCGPSSKASPTVWFSSSDSMRAAVSV